MMTCVTFVTEELLEDSSLVPASLADAAHRPSIGWTYCKVMQDRGRLPPQCSSVQQELAKRIAVSSSIYIYLYK